MDDLKLTIETLPEEDRKELATFIRRQKKKKTRKDLELYKLLLQQKSYTSEQLIQLLYPEEPNAVAYYALRKRLQRHLTDFILLKRMEEDITAASPINGLLSLANYLFDVRIDRLAWAQLRKAEKLAQANEQYGLLNTVYNLQIEKADNEFADPLEQIIEKRNQNKLIADEDERANIASSIINLRLRAVRKQGSGMHFDRIIQEVLRTYDLSEAISQRPSLLYKLMSIARSAILARKDFLSFEPYIISKYKEAEQGHGFKKAHQYYKISLLYMIAHVLYRNKKFEQSVHYLQQLHACMATEGKSHAALFMPRYTFLMVANQVFLNRNDDAIKLMEHLLGNNKINLSTKDQLTAQLGLSFNYFAGGAYSKANRLLLSIKRSDKWCEEKMGREWVLKKKLGELILQYELGNEDLVQNKLRALERAYKDLWDEPMYRNVKHYLELIRLLLEHPEQVSKPAFVQLVDNTLEFTTFKQTDLAAMSFYAWLKSKMLQKPYYDVLMELTKSAYEEQAQSDSL
ncbi:hypothetical protein ABID22_000004 [Pontibacter aydingkolensis]|uniref:Tetratricopeptide repeat-containing protein n=1 Tax=Pontibacter aydingkolensis TaxID=1911536 RepID=A0ABS7CR93_9BACT|nr:hypothetical protein [Pontibacter aydingkolensis]MBW7466320.1 hypothetical protein [Pontibacter aydingkolensis]